MFNSTKKIGAIALAAGLVGSAGIAAAAFNWTASGDGPTTAQVHTQTIHVSASTPAADSSLYPGNAAGSNVAFKIDNPNGYEVTVTSVVRSSDPIASDKGSACDATNVTFAPSITAATGTVLAHNTTNNLVTLVGNL